MQNPTLGSLYQTLVFWDTYVEQPKLKLHELFDVCAARLAAAGNGIWVDETVDGETVAELKRLDLPYSDVERVIKRRKTNTAKRHIVIAEQYIENAALGEFPKKTHRQRCGLAIVQVQQCTFKTLGLKPTLSTLRCRTH